VYLATQCAVLESKADMQKRGQASPDDGDALALTFAQPVPPAEVEELGFNHVTNFGLVHTPDRTKANMRAYMWDKMKDWLLHGAIETDEKMAADLAAAPRTLGWPRVTPLDTLLMLLSAHRKMLHHVDQSRYPMQPGAVLLVIHRRIDS
jgi:hypothetical protein